MAIAAAVLNIDERNLYKLIHNLKTRASLQGNSPNHDMTHTAPDTHVVKGVSTLYGDEGQIKQQWVKTDLKKEAEAEAFRDSLQVYLEEVPPIKAIAPPDRELNKDIIPWVQIGDAHLGMLAHDVEVGHNFDLKIAEQELTTAIKLLIDRLPDCDRCVIQDMGDFTHYQDCKGITESGHMLDYDTRYHRMMKVYHSTMRTIVEAALSKFLNVDVIINQGNHSRSNDLAMVETLRWVYQDNPRLNVLDNSNVFIPYRMGNTFVMSHHSDKCKPNQLTHVMATDYAKDWGETVYRYIDIGHIHHGMVKKEHPGVTVESFNQIAPADKYAHEGGWRSRSFLTAILRSKTYGEKGRELITAEEVKDTLKKLKPGTAAKQKRKIYSV